MRTRRVGTGRNGRSTSTRRRAVRAFRRVTNHCRACTRVRRSEAQDGRPGNPRFVQTRRTSSFYSWHVPCEGVDKSSRRRSRADDLVRRTKDVRTNTRRMRGRRFVGVHARIGRHHKPAKPACNASKSTIFLCARYSPASLALADGNCTRSARTASSGLRSMRME